MEDIFKFQSPSPAKLLAYGFKKRGSEYWYLAPILVGQFSLEVRVTEKQVESRVLDNSTGEEYALYKVEDAVGAFVGEVKEAAKVVLEDICQKAFTQEVFSSGQAKRILAAIEMRFGDQLEFLWEKFPSDAILRRKDTKKWYAVFMIIPKFKLGDFPDQPVELVDLRIDMGEGQKLVDNVAIFEGYHMNKKSWLTICFDSGVSDEKILELLENSYNLATK